MKAGRKEYEMCMLNVRFVLLLGILFVDVMRAEKAVCAD